jgi:DNA-binding PadR family transcriptional regulator
MSLEHVLLALLSDHSATGYELKKRIDQELDPFWKAELSQIYPSLGKLRRAGFASVKILGPDRGPGRNLHRITPQGRRELDRWWKEPMQAPDFRDESILRLLAAECGGGPEFALAIRSYDRALSDEMQRVRDKPPSTAIGELVRQAALSHLEAVRRWARAKASISS